MEEDQRLLERILDRKEKPADLSLALLQKITNDFSEERKIGKGGFGAVYKGVLGERNVAVKKIYVNLEKIDDDDKQFGREIKVLWNTNHWNIVRFLGFCSNIHKKRIQKDGSGETIMADVRQRLFCFEYISNGSLDRHITDELRGLEWETHYEIITGICEGLRYLHEEKKIIHMDLKPANILIDYRDEKYMVPKITDFGLSRPNKDTHTAGTRYGTRGYIAPEYEKYGETTFMSDIYSLGAIIMELATGGREVPDKHNVLQRWRHRWGKPPTLGQYQQVTRCIDIAVRCRKHEPDARPSIHDVIKILSESECMDGHTGQEISTYLDDDMLGIEPLELHFNKEMSWSIKLTNKTKTCFSFNIEGPSQYFIRPVNGIVPPGSENLVQIAVQPGEKASEVTQNGDKFIVQSRIEVGGKLVDVVDLLVVYDPVSPKAIDSSSYEDSARGQLDRHNFHPPENFSHSQHTNMTYLVRASDRAMDVTSGAMGSLLHKLGELQEEKLNLETSVKKDFHSLAEELMTMQPVLRKMSEVQPDNLDDLVKVGASNVREISYDLEDFVDGFLVHSEPDSDSSGFRELTHEMCFLLDKDKSQQSIGDLIKEKRKQVQDAAEKCKEYKIDNTEPNAFAKAAIEDLWILSIYEDKEKLVGIETPRDEVIRLFEGGSDVSKQNLSIVSIVGLGGLGMTTLAKAVYDKLKAQADLKTFVSVGQNPDVNNVLKKIIGKFEDGFNADNLGEIIEKLRESLEHKRYFIVIDDIWDSDAWGRIISAFPRNSPGSRVITTTRIHDVALATCNTESDYVYEIKPLSDEDSRRLFFRKTFGAKTCFPDTPRKEEISNDILKRCGGMPLAINSIASRLAGRTDSTWEYVRKSLGSLTKGNDLLNMKLILNLSYMHLPVHLKTCLLHVCMYPEDYEIDKNDLLRQWVAEGFVVSTNGRMDAEDVAEQYFKELINMCMIQPGRIDYNDEVLSCRVHDIILDLIRSKSTEVNFIQVIDGSEDKIGAGEIRRVSVHYDEKNMRILETINKRPLKHVRSVLVYRTSLLVPYFLVSKFVRVLHLVDRKLSKKGLDLTGISTLLLLRYLKVHFSFQELKLPDQIGHLQQLETIDLHVGKLENCPSDIVTLPRLSHLRNSGFNGIVLPYGIERLKSLRTLEGVCAGQSSVETICRGLGELTNLRNLSIHSSFLTSESEEVASAHMNAFKLFHFEAFHQP